MGKTVIQILINSTNIEIFPSLLVFIFSFSLMKSASLTLERSTSSLPTLISPDAPENHSKNDPSIDSRPFSELAKKKLDSDKTSNRELSTEDSRTQIPLEPSVFVSC